jgi:hypothetical protein
MTLQADKYFCDEDSSVLRFHTFTLDGEGVTSNMAVDGSSTPQSFEFGPDTTFGNMFMLNSLHFQMQDAKNWDLTEFGNLGAALTNGLTIGIYRDSDDAQLNVLTSFAPIKQNVDFYQYFPETNYIDYGTGATDAILSGHLYTSLVVGAPRSIPAGISMRVIVNDNLTGLTRFRFFCVGYYGKSLNTGVRRMR